MKTKLLVILSVLLVSCKQNETSKFLKVESFILNEGLYYSKSINILVKEFKDGSMTYGIADKHNKLIYQHDIFTSFSKSQYWFLYLDKDENVWFYSSDIQTTNVLMKDSLNNYKVRNYCSEKLILPQKVVKELSNSSNNFCG